MAYSVAVAGASGYAGGEVLRLLSAHPDFEVRTVTAHSNAGQPLIQQQPHLRSLAHLTLKETSAATLAGHDVVILALPHGKSGEISAALPAETLVVDAGADHRLTSEADWAGNQAPLWGSLLPAAWSLALALRARGLGTTWTTLHLAYEREVADLLGIPADVHQGVLLPVAYTKGTDFQPGRRVDMYSVLHVNGW